MKLLGTLMVDLLSRTVKFNIDTLSVSLSVNGCYSDVKEDKNRHLKALSQISVP